MEADPRGPNVALISSGVVWMVAMMLYSYLIHVRIRKNVEFESRRQYFPLNFATATRYRVVPDPHVGRQYNVFNKDGALVYRLIFVPRCWWQDLYAEMWILKGADGSDITVITRKRMDGFRGTVLYYLRSTTSERGSLLSPAGVFIASLAPPPVPLADLITVTPYVDPSISVNKFVSRETLGPDQEMSHPVELLTKELRKVHRLRIKVKKSWCELSFQLVKNGMNYTWKASGYLEKSYPLETDPTSVRVALIQAGGVSKFATEFVLYVDTNNIDEISVLSTAFIGFRSDLWRKKKHSYN